MHLPLKTRLQDACGMCSWVLGTGTGYPATIVVVYHRTFVAPVYIHEVNYKYEIVHANVLRVVLANV